MFPIEKTQEPMNTNRSHLLHLAVRTLVAASTGALSHSQDVISLNFTDGTAESTVSLNSPGAIPIAASNWNNLASVNGDGNAAALLNQAGAATGAAISWVSANTWRAGHTPTTGNGQLTKGYLDDGGGGAAITVTNIPFLLWNAYVIVGTDQGGATQTNTATYRPITVNGQAYRWDGTATVQGTAAWQGQNWTQADTLTEGLNYLRIPNQGGQTGVILGGGSGTGRGPIAGVQIEDAYSGSFVYWDLNGATGGAGGPVVSGTWDGSSANWNPDAAGTGGGSIAWPGAGNTAVFSAGDDATGNHVVTISGTRQADAVILENGGLTLTGGTLDLVAPAIIRAGGNGMAVNSTLSGTSGVVLEGTGGITLSGSHPVSGGAVITTPSLTLPSGTNLPNLSGVAGGTNVVLQATGSSIATTGGMSFGNGSSLLLSGATFTSGGVVTTTGTSITASGATSITADSLFANAGTAAGSVTANGTASITLQGNGAGGFGQFQHNSGLVDLSDNAKIEADRYVNRGSGLNHTLNISGNATIDVSRDLVFGDNSNAAITIAQTGGSVVNTGTVNNPGGNDLSNRWGHWGGGTTVYNLSAGTLALTGAPLYLSWDGTATLNVSGTGAASIHGIDMGFGGRTQASTINLTGGRLDIGSAGIVTGGTANKTINLGNGTLGALASWASPVPMNVTGTHTIDTGNFDISLSGALGGAGSITKNGAGILSLGGTNTYTGATTVTGGGLRIGGSHSGPVTVTPQGTIRAGTPNAPGTGTLANLTLGEGSRSAFRLGASSDRLDVTAPAGVVTDTIHHIDIEGAFGLGAGTYTLIDYDTSIGGDGFAAMTLGTMPHIVAQLVHNEAATSVDLVVTSVDTLVWTGANGSDWNLNDAQNWKLASNSNAAPYFQTDLVLFDDTASTGNVVIDGSILPGDVEVNNDTVEYVFSGSGIAGSTDLIKSGPGKLTLLNANTYTGVTSVNEGTLQIGDGSTGSIAGTSEVTVLPDATLILHPSANGNFANPLTLQGTLLLQGSVDTGLTGAMTTSSPGEIVIDSTGTTSFTTVKSGWSGDLTVNAGIVRTTGFNITSMGTQSNARTLTFNAGSTLRMEQNNIFGGGGTPPENIPLLVLNGSTLESTRYNVLGDVTMNGATITGAPTDGPGNYEGYELRGNITVTGSAPSLITVTNDRSHHLDSDTVFTVADVTTDADTDLLISAPLKDGSPDNASVLGSLTKAGAGTLELASANTYTGATDVDEGTLHLTGSLANSTVTVAPGATLSGTGTAGGTVFVDPGATLSPGASAGTLSVGLDLILDGIYKVEIDGGSADRINVAGELDITLATVDFSVLSGGAALPVYVIAEYGSLTGTQFASVNNLPAGYNLVYNHGPESNQIALVDPSADPYDNWATTTHGLSGNDALADSDPDDDGITNAIEFVIGGDPADTSDSGLLPTGAVAGNQLVFTFRRTDLASYTNPVVEYGSDLTGWTVAQNGVGGVSIVVDDDDFGPGIDRVTVSIPQALATGGKLFARLKVTIP